MLPLTENILVLVKKERKIQWGGNKIRGKENWFKTKMLLLEKYNLKSS